VYRSADAVACSCSTPRPTIASLVALAALEQRFKEVCQTRVRYGYRRVHVLLRREGWSLGQNKTRRIYRELGSQVRNKTPKRRVKAKLREDRRNATRCNQELSEWIH
jgi:transposase InsO family protein